MESVYEQIFLMKYYANWSFFETYNLPIVIRNWFYSRIAKEKEHAPGTLGKQARLAQTLSKISKHKTNEADVPPNDALASPLTMEAKKAKPDFLDLDKDGNKKESMKKAFKDKKKKEMVEAKNQADTLIYTAEKTLSDAGDKVSDEDKKPVTEAVAALKEKKDTEDVEELKKLTEDLNNKLMKIGEKMYQDQGTAEPKEGEAKSEDAEEKKSDEAEEGEIVDDKKEEK